MYTDCPLCRKQFRLTAEHLAAARGVVRCGFCGEVFDALGRLHDAPLREVAGAEVDDDAAAGAEPEFEIPEPESAASPVPPPELVRPAEPAPPPEPVSRPPPAPATAETEAELELAFAEEAAPARSGFARALWGAGSVLLLLAGLAQGLWFNRDALLSRYPEFLPRAEQLCEHVGCNLIRFRDVSAITLINRDVRVHPRYEDALLINATISNKARRRQAYPTVQLVLFDTEQKVIAHREFAPREYLDASIDTAAGMPPDDPVHFVLEVSGELKSAIGFEFRFM